MAFSNSIGGSILFGVDDDRLIIGLSHVHDATEKINNLIKTKVDPLIMFSLKPVTMETMDILVLEIVPGKMTPYYYVNEGTRTVFVRIGNETVVAPSYFIHELTFKIQRPSFDALSTNEKFSEASFYHIQIQPLQGNQKKNTGATQTGLWNYRLTDGELSIQ